MEYDYKLHKKMWQALSLNPTYKKKEIIQKLFEDKEIDFDEREKLLNAQNNCLACQYAMDYLIQLKLCPFETPFLNCCYCPFRTKNMSTEDCMEGKYNHYIKLQNQLENAIYNKLDDNEIKRLKFYVKKAALDIANMPLKKEVKLKVYAEV